MNNLFKIIYIIVIMFSCSCSVNCDESLFVRVSHEKVNNKYFFSKRDKNFSILKRAGGFAFNVNNINICQVLLNKEAVLDSLHVYYNNCLDVLSIDTYSKNGIGKIVYNFNTGVSDYILNTKRPLKSLLGDCLTLDEYFDGEYIRYTVRINNEFVRKYDCAKFNMRTQEFEYDDNESFLEFGYSVRYKKIPTEVEGHIISHDIIKLPKYVYETLKRYSH